MRLRESTILLTVLILSMAGIGLSTFLVANHYQFVSSGFCSINPLFSCENVNTGPWSTIPAGGNGIPWSVIGLVGFVMLFVLAYLRLYYPHWDKKNRFITYMLALSVVGVVFVVYLNYLEFFEIHQICLLCAISHIIMVMILILVAWWFFIGQKKVPAAEEPQDDSALETTTEQ